MGAKKINLIAATIAVLLFFRSPAWGSSPAVNGKEFIPTTGGVDIMALIDPSTLLSCAKVEIIGICFKGIPPRPGILIRIWRPELLVETVKRPGDTTLPFIGSVTSAIAAEALKSLTGKLITSGSQGVPGGENLQFNEVHVYDFPFKNLPAIFFGGMWCYGSWSPFGSLAFFKYFSEVDALEWRMGTLESIVHVPQILLSPVCISPVNPGQLCMGTWGPIYPRTGFLPHQSETVGSAAGVFRAVSNTWVGSFNHVKLVPNFWQASTADKIQFLYPRPSGCIKIGTTPATWDNGRRSPNGKYLYLYWRQIKCCI